MEIAPSEFWGMSPDEIGAWYNAKRPRKGFGNMSEDNAKSITDRINANPDKYA